MTAKRYATTSTSPTWRPGRRARTGAGLRGSWSRSTSSHSRSSSAPTSEGAMKAVFRVWRQREPERRGRVRPLRGGRSLPGDDAAGGARPPERSPRGAGRAARRLRQRLPRGHLRRLRHRGGRPPPWPAAAHHDLPRAHARLPRRRHDHARALPHRRVPRAARPRGGSPRARPRDAGRRLRVRAHGQRARGQCAAHRARGGGARAGRRDLHRVRSLRGRVPERLGGAVRRRQGEPSRRACPRASRSARGGPGRWWPRRTARASAPARATASARRCARRASGST